MAHLTAIFQSNHAPFFWHFKICKIKFRCWVLAHQDFICKLLSMADKADTFLFFMLVLQSNFICILCPYNSLLAVHEFLSDTVQTGWRCKTVEAEDTVDWGGGEGVHGIFAMLIWHWNNATVCSWMTFYNSTSDPKVDNNGGQTIKSDDLE